MEDYTYLLIVATEEFDCHAVRLLAAAADDDDDATLLVRCSWLNIDGIEMWVKV